MTDQDTLPDGGRTPPRGWPARRALPPIALAVALAVIVIVLLARPDPDPSGTTDPPATSPPSATGVVTGSASAGPQPSPTESASPSRTTPRATPSGRATRSATTAAPPTDDPRPPTTRSPVPLRTPAEVRPGLTARITDLEAVEGQAQGPGEVAGAAVRFRLVLGNTAAEELPLSTTVVNLYYGPDRTPASPLDEPGGAPLPAAVAAGGEATGTFVFVVPPQAREDVLITVDYSVDVSLVAFRGSAPR